MIKLFSATLFLALGVFSIQAQACTETRSITCVGHDGQPVSSVHCVNFIPSFHYGDFGDGEAALGQTPESSRFCSCPGGGWVDLDGDGYAETAIEDAPIIYPPNKQYLSMDKQGDPDDAASKKIRYVVDKDGNRLKDENGDYRGISDGTSTLTLVTKIDEDGIEYEVKEAGGSHEDGDRDQHCRKNGQDDLDCND